MTLEQIKNEITERIKEVRDSSSDLSGCSSYDDLQKLFKKVIGKVALCESAADLEAIDGLLSAIEELYNDCNSEASGEVSEEILFEFNFELDADVKQDKKAENEVPQESEKDADADDKESEDDNRKDKDSDNDSVSTNYQLKELEELRSKYIKKSVSSAQAHKARKIYKKSLNKIYAANDEDSFSNAQNYYIEAFNRLEKSIERKNLYNEAKKVFDNTYLVGSMKKPNIARLCVGCVAALSGVGFGLINARPWPWIWPAWAIIGVGISYLIISAIYAVVIAVGSDKAVRSMSITRVTLAIIMAAVSLALGLIWSSELTLLGAYIATVPFTIFGALTYIIYRIRLLSIFSAVKKGKKKPDKQNQKG